jgi:hypothetical protein
VRREAVLACLRVVYVPDLEGMIKIESGDSHLSRKDLQHIYISPSHLLFSPPIFFDKNFEGISPLVFCVLIAYPILI